MKGMIQIYTGNGKGKTTAAIGLSVRALGAGKKVFFLQFMKAGGYSEQRVMAGFAPQLKMEAVGKPFFIAPEGAITNDSTMAKGEAAANKSVATDSSTATSGSTTAKGGATGWKDHVVTFPPGKPPAEYLAIIDKGLAIAAEALTEGEYDLVVLDEINVALHFGLIAWDKLAAILDQKAEQTEVVLTGRGAPSALMEKADLVTEMKEVKHYYNEGVEARLGIEN